MLIVLSDLHFSEAASTQIGTHRFNRNLPPETFLAYFHEVNQFALANDIRRIDLVLAGDILELSRSAIWLEGDCRPYINNDEVLPGSETEKTILKIIEAIASENRVSQTLQILREIQKYFEIEVHLTYILGNHDRLANATPEIRIKVRELFGLSGGAALFNHSQLVTVEDDQPFCLVRHGHEYDSTNFSLDVRKLEAIPPGFPENVYGKSCLGDITTIEFGAALPWLFVKEYGIDQIVSSPTLMAVYQRLMEFDDVRPTTAWLSYLFSTPGVTRRQTWKIMAPCFTEIINTLSRHEAFNQTLKQSAAMSPLTHFFLMALLRSRVFGKGIPYWLIKLIMRGVSRSINLKSQVEFAKLEGLIQDEDSGCKCVISGHTHFAEVSLISAEGDDQRYYLNTGTWRNVIPATKNYEDFGRLKALTKVMVFYPIEKTPMNDGRDWAFHYLSGVSFGSHRLI